MDNERKEQLLENLSNNPFSIDQLIVRLVEISMKDSTPGEYVGPMLNAAAVIRQLRERSPSSSNAPLTVEELREMEGEPVWCQSEHRPGGAGWYLVDATAQRPCEFIAVGKERGIPYAGIESGYWKAYRRKPEEVL